MTSLLLEADLELLTEKDNYQELYERYRLEAYFADCWHWRQRKCRDMLKEIDSMIQKELGRRIMAESSNEKLREKDV